jgi:Flp pilus assembly protein TadD
MTTQGLAILLILVAWPSAGFADECGAAVDHRDGAAVLYAGGDLAGAFGQMQMALAACPQEPFYAFMLGNAAYRAGRFEQAAAAYAAFVKQRPTDFEGHLSLGFALHRLGDAIGAVHHWAEAVRLDPASPLARAAVAVGLVETGDLDNAAIQAAQATRLSDSSVDFHGFAIDIRWSANMQHVFDHMNTMTTP